MATVRNLACLAFRPEALDVHALDEVHAKKYGKQPTKCIRIEVIVQLKRGRVFRFCTFSKNFPLAAQLRQRSWAILIVRVKHMRL